ncbi:patatin-like phospholipase family protein [Aminobacter anthyllidis]|uniref:patatin-like phospholipase family protein n=1 Tax=Aminobacter anthyllidis TaxID=1035067 RepID=UPI0024558B48|nr:patatin-like phospholipase family protein [Aminobacter anthyllidis]MDH4985539.1 patatin-like phospholipase family protein [Aminobacter anthyllidis]
MRLAIRTAWAVMAGLSAAGCVASDVGPINTLTAHVGQASPEFIPDIGDDGSTVVGLSFSGGGTRAAAFAYGVLRELDDTIIDEHPVTRSLVDDIRMISGASGGAVAASYFGYRGRDDYRDFRERFLVKDAEAYLRTSTLSPVNLARALNGGVNDRNGFARWLEDSLFNGATYANFRRPDAPIVWINASDIYNRTPFLFTYDTFAALCSDLDKVRLSDAVAASAAVPVVFAPVVLSATMPKCGYSQPAWLSRALADPDASVRLKAYAGALKTYQHEDRLDYVKLLDGGLTDNLGITGFTIERSSAGTPYGPLSPAAAVKLRTLLFIVADAGREDDVDWGETIRGPGLGDLLEAVTNTTFSAAVRDQLDALKFAVGEWRGELIRYRCSLSAETVRRYRGSLAGWNCRDVRLVLEHLSFADLDPAAQAKLNRVPTRLKLPVEQVDLTIAAGREALRGNDSFQEAVADIRSHARVLDHVLGQQQVASGGAN